MGSKPPRLLTESLIDELWSMDYSKQVQLKHQLESEQRQKESQFEVRKGRMYDKLKEKSIAMRTESMEVACLFNEIRYLPVSVDDGNMKAMVRGCIGLVDMLETVTESARA